MLDECLLKNSMFLVALYSAWLRISERFCAGLGVKQNLISLLSH